MEATRRMNFLVVIIHSFFLSFCVYLFICLFIYLFISHEALSSLQDTTRLIQRPCYQRGSPRQYAAGNWTTRRPSDDRKKTQTAVVWSCLPFIKSGQNHLARHSERGKKTWQEEEEAGKQHQGMDKPGVRQVPEGSGQQRKMEETGWKIFCGAPTTLAVKE